MTDDELLMHYGVLGMKWGVRRHRNNDGTLTDSGRKKMLATARKYESDAGKIVPDNHRRKTKQAKLIQEAKDIRSEVKRSDLTKIKTKKEAKKKAEQSAKKSAKDMSNDELAEAIRRKELENAYNRLHPKQVSAGKKFAQRFVNEAVVPAVTNSTRNLVQAYLEKKGKELLNLKSIPKPKQKH